MWTVNQNIYIYIYIHTHTHTLSKSIYWLKYRIWNQVEMDFVPISATHWSISCTTLLYSLLPSSLLLSIYSVLDSCQRLVGQSSHIPEGEHGRLIGKKFVVHNTRKGADEEMSQTWGDNRLEGNNGRWVRKDRWESGCKGPWKPG